MSHFNAVIPQYLEVIGPVVPQKQLNLCHIVLGKLAREQYFLQLFDAGLVVARDLILDLRQRANRLLSLKFATHTLLNLLLSNRVAHDL